MRRHGSGNDTHQDESLALSEFATEQTRRRSAAPSLPRIHVVTPERR
jgi:hypothetical protein